MFERTECSMGPHRFVVSSDLHVPQAVDVALTPSSGIVEQEVRLTRGNAVVVDWVWRHDNGWKAGLESGDVITACNAVPIRNLMALRDATENAREDAPVELTV